MRAWVLRKDGRYWDGYFEPSESHFVGLLTEAHIIRYKTRAIELCQKLTTVGLKPVQIQIVDLTKTSQHPKTKHRKNITK